MAEVFVSYTRADQEIVRRVVSLLEAQGWSVWWDTRLSGGERWDEVIEREITAARCVVVVWTPQSVDREWVREEADHGRDRGILVPVLLGIDKPPFGFGRIHARSLAGWDGVSRHPAVLQFLADVRQKLEEGPLQPPAVALLPGDGPGGEQRSRVLDAGDEIWPAARQGTDVPTKSRYRRAGIPGSRPVVITIMCVLGAMACVLGAVGFAIAAWSVSTGVASQNSPRAYLALAGGGIVMSTACVVGLWLMRKWAVYLYAGWAAISQAIMLAIGDWHPLALVVPGVGIVVMFIYLPRMR
jgi:hypothetical protein